MSSLSFKQGFISLSPSAKLLLLVLIILLFALFGTILAMVIAVPVYGYNILELSNILGNPGRDNIAVIKFFQIFQSVTLFIIPALLAAWLYSEKLSTYLSTTKAASLITILLVFLSIVAAIPALNVITGINSKLDLPASLEGLEKRMILMEESAAKLTELFLESSTFGTLAINLIMIAILPAIGEEFLFRGVIQRLLGEWMRNGHLAVILTAFLFSFIHFQFYGFVPRFLLGLYFGYLLLWSGSIWVPVAAHLINNGMAVLYFHFADDPASEAAIDTIGTGGNSHYLLYVSIIVTTVLITMIYLREKGNKRLAY